MARKLAEGPDQRSIGDAQIIHGHAGKQNSPLGDDTTDSSELPLALPAIYPVATIRSLKLCQRQASPRADAARQIGTNSDAPTGQ